MSLLLRANTEDLQVVTGSAADLEVHISALQADSAAPPALRAIPNYGPRASITTATTTQIVDTSGLTNNDVVNVIGCILHNNHASTATTVRVEVTDGTDTVVLANVNLLAGERLELGEDGRWFHYDSNGGLYPSVGNAASQAEMEAGTATDKFVTPQGVNWHPGANKFWVKCGVTANVLASWNVTSLTDNGTGDVTVTIATDFSSVDWACQVAVEMTATTYAVANARTAHIRSGGQAAGTVRCDCIDGTATTQLVKDPTFWHISGLGDQ